MIMKKYKVLNKDLKSPFQLFKYEIGKEYICNDFDDSDKECSNGFYATDIEGLPYSFNINKRVFEVEVSGKQRIFNQYKQRFEKQTIIRELHKDEIIALAKLDEDRLGFKLSQILFPVNPRDITPPQITQEHIDLLKQWVNLSNTLNNSSFYYINDTINEYYSTKELFRTWKHTRDGLMDCIMGGGIYNKRFSCYFVIMAYISSAFPNITKWKHINHEEGINPFQSAIDLWNMGLIPLFDGRTWRLYGGKKLKPLFEIKASDI